MFVAHKIQLKPNKSQILYFAKSVGIARFAYNWALAEWERQYKADERPSEISLRKQLNSIKREEFPWMYEVTKTTPQQAIKNLGVAFSNFFRRIKNGEKPGYPRFKKKGKHESFRADDGPSKKGLDSVATDNKQVKLPRIGWVKMTERVRFGGQIKSVTISKTAGRWFATFNIDTTELPHVRKSHGACGIDLGITHLAALSDGRKIEGPKALIRLQKELRTANKHLSRKRKGSGRWYKARRKLQRLHYRVTCVRKDALHKLTTELVLNNSLLAIEDLNVKGMVKNHNLAKHLQDQSFGEFRRMLEYKAAWYESTVFVADRFFPSTKLCMECGQLHDMPLSKRTFQCDCDDIKHDRDTHAANNLIRQALSNTPVETEALATISICSETTINETGINLLH